MSVGSSDGWSHHAPLYAQYMENATLPYGRYLLAALQTLVPTVGDAPLRVLDVAAGPGALSVDVARRVARVHVTSTDFAPGMVALCADEVRRLAIDNVVARVANALALPFAENEFDFVVSNFGIGVLREPELSAAIAEALRVVRPGGRVLFTAWSMDRDVGALPAHATMIKALTSARGPPPDGASPAASRGLPAETDASLREKLAALPLVADDGVRIADCRSSFVMTVASLAALLVDNPGTMSLVAQLADAERAAFERRVALSLLESTRAASVDEAVFLGASANLVIVTKKRKNETQTPQ